MEFSFSFLPILDTSIGYRYSIIYYKGYKYWNTLKDLLLLSCKVYETKLKMEFSFCFLHILDTSLGYRYSIIYYSGYKYWNTLKDLVSLSCKVYVWLYFLPMGRVVFSCKVYVQLYFLPMGRVVFSKDCICLFSLLYHLVCIKTL